MSHTADSSIYQMRFALCPHCGEQIVRASVGATASELWHQRCWLAVSEVLETTIAAARELPSAPPRRVRPVMIACAGALALAGWFLIPSTAASIPSSEIAVSEPVVWMDVAVRPETPNAAVDPLAIHKIPTLRGKPTTELYPTLATWIHPVVNTSRVLPELSSGGFGAERDGVMRRECGQGHCGDDINGPIGRPIVAVADGIVAHVDRSRLGADKRSGRYVKIEHEDGTTTSYMHLNAITEGLERGDRVLAGQQIGTLGKTAVRFAAPHLHFALEVPTGKGTNMRYLDPAPYLVRAKVMSAPDRRPPQKPAW
jgi:peptidase M23-like protein